MNQNLLTRIFTTALTAIMLGILFFAPEDAGPWFRIIVGAMFVLDGVISIWMKFRKAANLKITEGAVFVCGLRVDRRDIQAWRAFRVTSNGERGRYIEIQLKRVPPCPFRWRLAKLYEPKRFDRSIQLATEPRIIASLNSWDLTKEEIAKAMDN